jgi:hypothetical protein
MTVNTRLRTKVRNRALWRRERDSNPRWSYKPHTPLAGERLQPLGHLSTYLIITRPKGPLGQAKGRERPRRLSSLFSLLSPRVTPGSLVWRRRRDSNPRWVSPRRFSRPLPSTTRPLLLKLERGGKLIDPAEGRKGSKHGDHTSGEGGASGPCFSGHSSHSRRHSPWSFGSISSSSCPR